MGGGVERKLFFCWDVVIARAVEVEVLGDAGHGKEEVEVDVADVGDDEAVGYNVAKVNFKGFFGKKVHGDGIAVEGI